MTGTKSPNENKKLESNDIRRQKRTKNLNPMTQSHNSKNTNVQSIYGWEISFRATKQHNPTHPNFSTNCTKYVPNNFNSCQVDSNKFQMQAQMHLFLICQFQVSPSLVQNIP